MTPTSNAHVENRMFQVPETSYEVCSSHTSRKSRLSRSISFNAAKLLHDRRLPLTRRAYDHTNIKDVPTHVAVPTPAPAYLQFFWPYSKYNEILHEQDPTVLRAMANLHPLAPVCNERCPEHMRPMHFDMEDPRCLERTLRWYIKMALAQGRPLDVRAGGRYRRIVDASDPMEVSKLIPSSWVLETTLAKLVLVLLQKPRRIHNVRCLLLFICL
jgi:hypothetical protein